MRSTTTFAAVALVAYVSPSTAAPIRKPLGNLRPLEGPGPVKPFSTDLLTPTVSDSDASSPPSVTGAARVDTTLKNQPELLDGVIEARKLKLPTIFPEIKKIGKIGGEIAGVVGTGIGIAKNLGHGGSPDDSDDSDSSADASAAPSTSAAAPAASSAPDSDDAASRRELEERSVKIPAGVKTGVKAIPKIIGGIGAGVSVCQFFGHCKGGSSSGDTTAASPAGAAGASATEAADTVASPTASADTAATTDSSDSVSRRQLEERFKISPKIKSAGHRAGKAAGTAGTLFGLCQTFGGCGADKDDSGTGDAAASADAASATGEADAAATATVSAADASGTTADSSASTAKRAIRHAIRDELVSALLARGLDELD